MVKDTQGEGACSTRSSNKRDWMTVAQTKNRNSATDLHSGGKRTLRNKKWQPSDVANEVNQKIKALTWIFSSLATWLCTCFPAWPARLGEMAPASKCTSCHHNSEKLGCKQCGGNKKLVGIYGKYVRNRGKKCEGAGMSGVSWLTKVSTTRASQHCESFVVLSYELCRTEGPWKVTGCGKC